MIKCIHLFSGGLDSVVSAHLLKSLGVDVTLIHFVLPFYSGVGNSYGEIKKFAQQLELPLRIIEEGEEFLGMIRDPEFGYGKNANPCVDCRIHRLRKTKKIMEELGALFISTGEVTGQRPMSQRRDMLFRIEKESGCKGILLRPLSAGLLTPTEVESEGLIDREKLLRIAGRGRVQQLEYARKFNLSHLPPAGGCILTNIAPAQRFLDLNSHESDYTLTDLKLIAYGRHFRLSPTVRLVISRNESENRILLSIVGMSDCYMYLTDVTGPLGVLRGTFTKDQLPIAASITARFSKARADVSTQVAVVVGYKVQHIIVQPADDVLCEKLRVRGDQ